MPGPATLQLLLLDSAVFEAGPSRARGPKRTKDSNAQGESLSLTFEKPRPAVAGSGGVGIEDVRRLALERSRARLLAKLEPAAARKRAAPPEAPPSEEMADWSAPAPEESGEQVVLLVRKKLTAMGRSAMMKAFADRLGGDLKRSDFVEARVGADTVTARLDAKSLTVRFSSRTARQRWLQIVQRLSREHDLVEPE